MPLEFIYSKCCNSEQVTIESDGQLPAGEYVALVEIDWKQYEQVARLYFVTTYSESNQIQLGFKSATRNFSTFDYLAELLKSCARQKTQHKNYSSRGYPDIFRCVSITDSKAEYGYLYYQNDSRNGAILKETILFNKLDNFKIQLEDGDFQTKIQEDGTGTVVHVRVPAGQNIIIVMRRSERNASYQVTYYSAIIFPED